MPYNIPSLVKARENGFDIIKTRPDNTVIIHQAKMYTRDEVISLIRNMPFDIELFYGEGTLNKWIQDNLK